MTIIGGVIVAIGWISTWPLSTAIIVARVLAVTIGVVLLAWAVIESWRMLTPPIRALVVRLSQTIRTRLHVQHASKIQKQQDQIEESVKTVPALVPVRTDPVPIKQRPVRPFFGHLRVPTDIPAMRVNVPDWFAPSVQALAPMPALADVTEQLRKIDIERTQSIHKSTRAAMAMSRVDPTVWRTPDFGSFIRNLG